MYMKTILVTSKFDFGWCTTVIATTSSFLIDWPIVRAHATVKKELSFQQAIWYLSFRWVNMHIAYMDSKFCEQIG